MIPLMIQLPDEAFGAMRMNAGVAGFCGSWGLGVAWGLGDGGISALRGCADGGPNCLLGRFPLTLFMIHLIKKSTPPRAVTFPNRTRGGATLITHAAGTTTPP
jgi:hypothetical protein